MFEPAHRLPPSSIAQSASLFLSVIAIVRARSAASAPPASTRQYSLPSALDAANPTTYYAVERAAYVEVVVPKEQAPASDALVDLGHVITVTVPKDPNAKP